MSLNYSPQIFRNVSKYNVSTYVPMETERSRGIGELFFLKRS